MAKTPVMFSNGEESLWKAVIPSKAWQDRKLNAMYLYYRKLILTYIFELLNRDPINFDKTEVKKRCDSDSGLFYYLKYDHFLDKTDKNGYIGRCYRTCQVDRSINYEDAKNKSISFRYDMEKHGSRINNVLVSKRHLNCGDKDNVHSGLTEWIFSDGSNISEWVSFTKKKIWF